MDARTKAVREMAMKITKELSDQGKVIEGGWLGLATVLELQPQGIQYLEMRKAFYAGAQHLFSSILTILDAGEEATEADMRRLDLIDKELRTFAEEL